MSEEPALTIQTDLLPPAELQRLLKNLEPQFPGLSVQPDAPPTQRSLLADPQIVTAVVGGIATVLSALLPKLIERLCAEEPQSKITIVVAGGEQITLQGNLSAAERESIISAALRKGAPQALRVATADGA